MNIRLCAILLPLLFAASNVVAQDSSGITNSRLVNSYADNISAKSEKIDQQLDNYTQKALIRVEKQEARIKKKLQKIDSIKATQVFANTGQQYKRLHERLNRPGKLQQYIPSLDTIGTSLKFLQENQNLVNAAKEGQQKLVKVLEKVKGMAGQFQKAEEVKRFLKERKEYLKEQLQGLGLGKELKKLNKQAYYYTEQLNEYKELLKDHKKAERKMIALLSNTKLFKDFMRKNSVLASLFRLPDDPNDPTNVSNLAGLQTRAQVNNLIQQQVSAGGPNAQQQLQQNLQSAQSQLSSLKNKFSQLGKSDSEDIMPEGFKPNNQKTKSFWQRLDLGTNIQSQKAHGYFPATSDIGLSAGYKLNEKSTVGIGGSYRLGLGRNIRNINLSHQGIGIRSFVDWKIKGSFWISGGYEMNYRSQFESVDELRNLNAWQESGLIGLSKVVSIKTKFFKKTKLQLLWDMLSYQHVPRTQPVVFRIGYSFK